MERFSVFRKNFFGGGGEGGGDHQTRSLRRIMVHFLPRHVSVCTTDRPTDRLAFFFLTLNLTGIGAYNLRTIVSFDALLPRLQEYSVSDSVDVSVRPADQVLSDPNCFYSRINCVSKIARFFRANRC